MSTPVEIPTTAHYSITADAHPGALPRILELFALRNITPDLVKVRQYKQDEIFDTNLSIDIHVSGLSGPEQQIIFHKLVAQVSVQNVRKEILFRKARPKLAS